MPFLHGDPHQIFICVMECTLERIRAFKGTTSRKGEVPRIMLVRTVQAYTTYYSIVK